ncbi:LysR family transcriptional regulator [Halomonas nitroreducens]|nr:LysR family transcriptional regulator [Halomonas nitroreducens]
MSPKVSIRHLLMIRAIADTGNVSAAAGQLGVTQSALSHRIREAERLLNTTLFYRKHKRLVTTSAGKRLLHTARVVLGEMQRAEHDIDKLSVGIEHVVRIGNEAYGGYHWMPGFLAAFRAEHPAIGIEIIPDVSMTPFVALRDGTIDLSIVSGPVNRPGVRVVPLFTDELVAVMAEGHPLAGQPWLSAEAIAGEAYITYHTTPAGGREYEQLFTRHQVLPTRVLRAGVTEAVVAFVRAGQGITIMPRWTLGPYLRQGGLVTAGVTDEGLDIDWQVVLRKDEPEDSPAAVLAAALSRAELSRR